MIEIMSVVYHYRFQSSQELLSKFNQTKITQNFLG